MYELHDALRDIPKNFSLFDKLDFDLVWARFWTTYEIQFWYICNFFLRQNSVLGWEPEQSWNDSYPKKIRLRW